MRESSYKYDLINKFYLPKRIIFEKDTINSKLLLEDMPRQSFSPSDESRFLIKAGGCILLDFGKELQGGITISTHMAKDATLHIVFGESVSEAMSELGERNSGNYHSMRDYEIKVGLQMTFETGNTGFRFVKISSNKDVYLNTIQAVCKIRDLEYKGSFECDDELLNTIWNTGAYTVHLNMQEYIWDGIKRDRLVWIGDMNPEMNTILSVFGNDSSIRKSLDLALRDLEYAKWIKKPSYSMWWIINQYELYMHSGDYEYLEGKKTNLFDIMEQMIAEIGEEGILFDNDYFIDWSSKNTPYEKAGFNAVLILALKASINLCEILEHTELGDKLLKKLENVTKNKFEYAGNKQVTALNYLSDSINKEEAEEILKKGGAENLSCFMGFYVLKALCEMKNIESAIDIIRQYWGAMVNMGATTFWEDFDIKWLENATPIDEIVPNGKSDIHGDNGKFCYTGFRHSLCHGWASGPTAIMSKYILGIYIEEPGFKKVKIEPQLGTLKFAKGSFPTPYGEIKVCHTNKIGEIKTIVEAPPEIEIIKS